MAPGELHEERLTESIIGAFYEVYNILGFGLSEHLYVMALERELVSRNHHVAREFWVNVLYKGELLGKQRLDLVVDDRVVVEAKATLELDKAAARQCLSYLRATTLEVGLVLHFGPKPGIKRVVCRKDGAPRFTGIRGPGHASEASPTTQKKDQI